MKTWEIGGTWLDCIFGRGKWNSEIGSSVEVCGRKHKLPKEGDLLHVPFQNKILRGIFQKVQRTEDELPIGVKAFVAVVIIVEEVPNESQNC